METRLSFLIQCFYHGCAKGFLLFILFSLCYLGSLYYWLRINQEKKKYHWLHTILGICYPWPILYNCIFGYCINTACREVFVHPFGRILHARRVFNTRIWKEDKGSKGKPDFLCASLFILFVFYNRQAGRLEGQPVSLGRHIKKILLLWHPSFKLWDGSNRCWENR